ncbi:MAG: hypothetical protein KBE65_14210 [Phycisphaerae bacterium]|nr:hypothetical protein [Phycisphaerae bacterium]
MIYPLSLPRSLSFAAIVALCGSACLAASSQPRPVVPEQYRRQMQQKENQQVAQDDAAAAARDSVQQLLNRASDTQKLFASLSDAAKTLFSHMQTLLDSDDGKRIARDPVAFMTYYELDKYPPVTMSQIQAHADAISAHVNRLKLMADAKQATVAPTQETRDQISELNFWANDRLVAVETQQAALNAILRRAPTGFDPATASTLRPVLDDYKARWYQLLSTSGILARERAADEVKERLVNANYLAELERAANEERRIREEMTATIAKTNAEHEAAMLRQKLENERLLSQERIKYADDMAELERLRKQADAERTADDISAGIQRQKTLDAAKKQQMIALAKSPGVQQVLAPFTTHGYWQPGANKPEYNRGPVSLSRLRSRKALDPTPQGLSALHKILIDKSDKERPRRAYSMFFARLSPTEMDELKETQQYLIELGDVMVELGMLAP